MITLRPLLRIENSLTDILPKSCKRQPSERNRSCHHNTFIIAYYAVSPQRGCGKRGSMLNE